ncbi:MAG: hypothetical protein P1S60_01890 [Anaerolineae bacterium]|nr:hypothetical protein [Anaerolineae bacterium]
MSSCFFTQFRDRGQVISSTVSTKGGGIYLECPNGVDPVDISNTVLAENLAASGSGLYSTVCDVNIAYGTVAGNRGTWGDGKGLYVRYPIGSDATYTIEKMIFNNPLLITEGVVSLDKISYATC